MRIGGPYTITAALSGFQSQVQNSISLTLGVVQDVSFTLALATVAETVTVTGETSPVFSSTRTGASTSVTRDELEVLPTVSGRINDITRLTPQYGGSGTFAGQDNRMNNITVDGSYFNNSFGLGGQPGDRTGVAPISLEAIEQVQVSVAPYDVRQGNFVGAGVNTVTRSGTNRLSASVYHRFRNESFVGTEAKGLAFNPGDFETTNTGVWAGGPILKNKLFAFGSFEKQDDTRPLSTFVANAGGQPAAGNVTRVLASDLNAISTLLSGSFGYDTGPYEGINKLTPAKPFLVKGDYNLNNSNKISFRYSRLDSSTDVLLSTSSSLGFGRSSGTNTTFLGYQRSNYSILEDYRSGHRRVELDDRQHDVEQPDDRLHDQRREPRRHRRAVSVHRHPRRVRRGATRRSAASRSRRTTSCATTPSSCRTISPSTPTATRSRLARASRSTTPRTCSSRASRAPTSTIRLPTSTRT